MGTLTAQILVGKAHPNHGGIGNLEGQIFLSENSRPALNLELANSDGTQSEPSERIVWIPTVENMLQDAILMAGLHVLKDQTLEAAWREAIGHTAVNSWGGAMLNHQRSIRMGRGTPIEMYRHLSQEDREHLYALARQMKSQSKVAITVFDGSTFLAQLPVLELYAVDVEVCTPQFLREYSSWGAKTVTRGHLDIRNLEV